jgi:hypothetical protein
MPSRTPYGEGTGIHVEWVTIRNRTVFLIAAACVVLLAGGAGFLWWMYFGSKMVAEVDAEVEQVAARDDSARFIELKGTVKVRKAGSYEWVDANRGLALRKNDTVRTIGKSSARIRLFDGTEYLVKPDTIFMIEVMTEDPRTRVRDIAVKLTAGQVNLQTPHDSVEGSRSALATPTTEASFDEATVAEVGYDESNQVADLKVYTGGSRVKAGGQEVQLESSQAVEVRGDVISPIIELPGIPILEAPAHLSRLVYSNPSRVNTELKWRRVDVARRYHVQLDSNPYFTEPQEYTVRNIKALVPGLRPGTYYWRVSAIDGKNNEGGFSEFSKFTITSQAARLEPPPLRLVQPTVSLDGLVTVNGVTEPDAVVTVNDERVDVRADGSFRHYFTISSPGRHAIVVKAFKRSGGTAEKTVYATIGSN